LPDQKRIKSIGGQKKKLLKIKTTVIYASIKYDQIAILLVVRNIKLKDVLLCLDVNI